jgi:hypothetical protein
MRINVEIPTKAQVVNGGFPCAVTAKGHAGAKPIFGEYGDKKGVYVLHASGKLLYIGKTTDGEYGTFSERLYRHLSESASNGSRIHKLLAKQNKGIKAYLLDLDDISMMIDSGSIDLEDVSKALIMEQILIGVFHPVGNNPEPGA